MRKKTPELHIFLRADLFKDSPASISKEDKEYQITITADYTGENVKNQIDSEVISPNLTGTITMGVNSRNRMMEEEFSALYQAIAVAVFLIFVVMSAQFESPKFSFLVNRCVAKTRNGPVTPTREKKISSEKKQPEPPCGRTSMYSALNIF